LATLPSKEEIIASILGSLNSPASGIVGAINAVFRDLVSVVDQISKREAA
jgi:large subunit ribosomal protein L10